MNRNDIIALLKGTDDRSLFAVADCMRRETFGNGVYLRGIIEFSSHCACRCAYCGLRAPNTDARRYEMSREAVLEAAALAPAHGLGTVVLQSGENTGTSINGTSSLISEIISRHDVAVTLSLGEHSRDAYALWREYGATRYLLKMETMHRELHERLRPGRSFDERLARLSVLRDLGYEVGSGIIVGLPGVTEDMLADDILRVSELELDMISAGPFVPHPATPLCDEPAGNVLLTHRVNALLRILNPLANIPATSALQVLEPGARNDAMARGANVIMPSLTPEDVRKDYTIYPGKNVLTVSDNLRNIIEGIRAAGFTPSSSRGVSPRFIERKAA